MTAKEIIAQLEDLKKDRESFADSPFSEPDNVFRKDIEALDAAIAVIEAYVNGGSLSLTDELPRRGIEAKETKSTKPEMSMAAKMERAAYMREWRRKHPDKQREYTARKWEKKAALGESKE